MAQGLASTCHLTSSKGLLHISSLFSSCPALTKTHSNHFVVSTLPSPPALETALVQIIRGFHTVRSSGRFPDFT